jgi:hypothetical protein
MANNNFTCPPQPATGAGTFSDNLVGFQLVAGGGLTQGNFEFTTGITEKSNRTFTTGAFSNPINLDGLGVSNIDQSRAIFENNFKVYPNFDLTQVTNFTSYGSMVKRMSTSIEIIISYFPAALEILFMDENYLTGTTATNISYNPITDETSIDLDITKIRNPFDIDFSVNATRNLELREVQVSPLRNMTTQFTKYSLFFGGVGYDVTHIIPTTSLTTGTLTIYLNGNVFSGLSETYDDLVIRPNDYEVNKVFNQDLDEVQRFLLNRNVVPIYTATFQVPNESDDGSFYIENQLVTWPLYGKWNLDIITNSFTTYLTNLNNISVLFDGYQTNLVSRFLTTDSLKEFDTSDQKIEKILQIYGRSFDETKKFINGLAYMNSVNYNTGNDIPSQLLKNLSQTLGWSTNMSPITNEDFLGSVFGQKNVDKSVFSGVGQAQTPDELNYQYYKNLVLNSAYLFKSKGTRKSIETLMRLIGAPDALVEFNEYVYLADQRINMSDFDSQYANITGGTYNKILPTLDGGYTFTIQGVEYSGFTTTSVLESVDLIKSDYPVSDSGYPQSPVNSETYYYQMGSGWFESTPKHRSPEQPDLTNSVFTGSNPNYQTKLAPFTYGQEYLNVYKSFPYTNLGYTLSSVVDNNKSWVDTEVGERINLDGGYNSIYATDNENLVINVKNIDLYLNPAQGLTYDVWYMSREYNFPIANEGLGYVAPTRCNPNPISLYPHKGGVDSTVINPQPRKETFFEFAQTFWKNTINVRNRQYATDGGTSGYPTLSSIYWNYLESESLAGVQNDNFTYKTMIDYVSGMGDYWIRLVEQMIPASTIWNTGVKLENSIFHRQKFVWRRQRGCELVPVLCKPCKFTGSIYLNDCKAWSTLCNRYPDSVLEFGTFNNVLSSVVNNWLNQTGPGPYLDTGGCNVNTINSQWFVDISINGTNIIQYPFFNGVGYNSITCGTEPVTMVSNSSSPCVSLWETALNDCLVQLISLGYDFRYEHSNSEPKGSLPTNVRIWDTNCTSTPIRKTITIKVGIQFNITCQQQP